MLSRLNICTEITMYRKWPSKYTHVHVYIISKRYWGETILSPQHPCEYWGESPCCPCGVGAYVWLETWPNLGIIIGQSVEYTLYSFSVHSFLGYLGNFLSP